ncbi:HYC_CC_PP family protein [Flagellimonas oceanensis]|uniref:HYC_CC_PP family protein n=2 Tax=Flagellimonas oceanensis TaxID=2499163 RepID=UPI003BAC596A|tara:strand:+ start:19867 stop:20253 length:387 start_codon:yes stop_codon:yes gene_type:complete
MKQFFHQIVSSLMALLVLASTVSWTVDKHICMGRVMDISLFSHADDCGMDMDMEKSCCDDETFTVQGQDDLKISFENFDLDQQVFLVSFVQTYFHLFEIDSEEPSTFSEYNPPPLIRDVQVLDQTFLI